MLNRENRFGLYLTAVFHLLLLIILLASKIGTLLQEESTFVLDFTREELLAEIARQEQLKEDVSRELEELLRTNPANYRTEASNPVRNVVVDASSRRGETLRDDRNSNPTEVYDEARRVQERLDAARREAEANTGSDEVANPQQRDTEQPANVESYKGPSVLSYTLDNRKSMSTPIPAYKCMGGGDVRVSIVVNRGGYVLSATVRTDLSSSDNCLQEFAVRAAKLSRFTSSTSAPERQVGEIVYRFIAQ